MMIFMHDLWCVCVHRDPSNTVLAFADMMKKKIVMPAHMMDDQEHVPKTGRGLFSDFSAVAQSTGTYTAVVGTKQHSTASTA